MCELLNELFSRDLDQPLQAIFLELDPVSLKNCRRVCKQWNAFIKRRVWSGLPGTPSYRRLRARLAHHWRHADPPPRSVDVAPPWSVDLVHCVSCDDSILVAGMKNQEARVFRLEDLDQVAVLDCAREGVEDGEVQQDIGKDVVATVTDKGDVSVWRRRDWSRIYKAAHHGNLEVYCVKIINNNTSSGGCVIVTGGCDGRLGVLRWDGARVELERMVGRDPGPDRREVRGNPMTDPLMMTHIDSNGEWLVSGGSQLLRLWRVGGDWEVVRTVPTPWVNSLALDYPYVVTVLRESVRVVNMHLGQEVKEFRVDMKWQVSCNSRFFSASSTAMPHLPGEVHNVTLYDLAELRSDNSQAPPGSMWRRTKWLGQQHLVSCCLNRTSLAVGQGRTVRVWDFWNTDQFSEAPDTEHAQQQHHYLQHDQDYGSSEDEMDY